MGVGVGVGVGGEERGCVRGGRGVGVGGRGLGGIRRAPVTFKRST